MNQSPSRILRDPPQFSLRRWLLWALAAVMLLELAVFLIYRNVGSHVFTETDGTWAQELWTGEITDSTDHIHPTPAKPYRVQIDAKGPPARLFIRYASGCGGFYMTEGTVELVSATGKTLWAEAFDGITDDIGPAIFACAFTDADGDGRVEFFFRQMESDYHEDNNGWDCSWKMGPLQVSRLSERAGFAAPSLREQFITRVMAVQVAFPLLDWYEKLAILALFPIPPILWLGVFLVGRTKISRSRMTGPRSQDWLARPLASGSSSSVTRE
jgi:hypothetical protein